MASTISAIKAQLITDIETTSIDNAYEGPVTKTVSTYPWAMVIFSGGRVEENITQQVDRNYRMSIYIYGVSIEQVEVALEELAVLWNDAAGLAAVLALGVIVLSPDAHYTPYVEKDSTQIPITGDMTFNFSVQYT